MQIAALARSTSGSQRIGIILSVSGSIACSRLQKPRTSGFLSGLPSCAERVSPLRASAFRATGRFRTQCPVPLLTTAPGSRRCIVLRLLPIHTASCSPALGRFGPRLAREPCRSCSTVCGSIAATASFRIAQSISIGLRSGEFAGQRDHISQFFYLNWMQKREYSLNFRLFDFHA
jgi:hypothetical protein